MTDDTAPRSRRAPRSSDRDGPVTRSANSVSNLYTWIRAAILNGRFGAGEAINQAQLAAQFGVSRTPLREALRMLQAEGLLVGEGNQRMRVATLSPSEIDSLYATRILLECFGIAVTTPRLSAGEVRGIQECLEHMNAQAWIGDRPTWETHHTHFHALLVQHARAIGGPVLNELLANFQLRCERYRRLYVNRDPKNTVRAIEDHTRIVEAVVARSVPDAIERLAEHYSHTALSVLNLIAPALTPVAVNSTIEIIKSAGKDFDGRDILSLVGMASALGSSPARAAPNVAGG